MKILDRANLIVIFAIFVKTLFSRGQRKDIYQEHGFATPINLNMHILEVLSQPISAYFDHLPLRHTGNKEKNVRRSICAEKKA